MWFHSWAYVVKTLEWKSTQIRQERGKMETGQNNVIISLFLSLFLDQYSISGYEWHYPVHELH